MTEAEFKKEREIDDSWTAPKLVAVIAATLGTGLVVIYLLASISAPY